MSVIFSDKGKSLIVARDRCKGCELCIEVCPVDVLEPSDKLNSRGVTFPAIKREGKCTLCTLCENMCPDLAIYILPDSA
ncbi:MAG: 4Fe-4S binding protein [Dehalococcoidia bacterium]|jgi:2-oxoglutarate ferredoxin oxidoreductase subunit delta|nr:4Fe-4S binding protein [Dehalococcoidia bacterium]MDP7240413.1 4Fe-4S binding protein [Dehalococcoidia bacterium]